MEESKSQDMNQKVLPNCNDDSIDFYAHCKFVDGVQIYNPPTTDQEKEEVAARCQRRREAFEREREQLEREQREQLAAMRTSRGICDARERLMAIANQIDELCTERAALHTQKQILRQAIDELIAFKVRRQHDMRANWSERWGPVAFPPIKAQTSRPSGWLGWIFRSLAKSPFYSEQMIVDHFEWAIAAQNKRISELRSLIKPLASERQEINYFLVRKTLTAAERETIWKRDGKCCYLCGGLIENWWGEHMHVDHVDAFSRGGTNGMENLRATHPRCNLMKSNKPAPIDEESP